MRIFARDISYKVDHRAQGRASSGEFGQSIIKRNLEIVFLRINSDHAINHMLIRRNFSKKEMVARLWQDPEGH